MENVTYENKQLSAPEKRGRGRPKKKPLQVITEAPDGLAELYMQQKKRGRGRPKLDPTKKKPKMTREQFWKFQALNADLSLAEEKMKLIEIGLKNLMNEAEVIKGKMLHLKTRGIEDARKNIDEARTAFQSFTEEIEGILGVSLKNKTIDEKTLEVKESSIEK